jgi:predicted hotdog family 3-hydroxylacyl-ACP dehydratase
VTEAELTAAMRAFIGMSAAEFVPHRDPMLLIDTVVDIGAGFSLCEWEVGESAFHDRRFGVPAYTGIETMAQCISVHGGARARIQGLDPPMGLLLGTRHFCSSIEYFEPGRTYSVRCDVLFRDPRGMSSWVCELASDGARFATARLAVLERVPY